MIFKPELTENWDLALGWILSSLPFSKKYPVFGIYLMGLESLEIFVKTAPDSVLKPEEGG